MREPSVVRGGGVAQLHHRIRAGSADGVRAARARVFAAVSAMRAIRRSDAMVTAEFAVGLLAVVPLLLSLVALTGIGATQVKLVEAARTGARLLARGEPDIAAREQVRTIVPGADIAIDHAADRVSFEVTQQVGGQGLLPTFTLRASAVTPMEESS